MKITLHELIFYWGKSVILNNLPWKLWNRREMLRTLYKTPYSLSHHLDEVHEFEIYSIAYNNAKLIDYQIRTMQKFLTDEHKLIIVDNSNDLEESQKIAKLCETSHTGYVKIPNNSLRYSWSHIGALNYTWRNIIKTRACKYI